MKQPVRRALAACLVVALTTIGLATNPAQAAPGPENTISGTVTDSNGGGFDGASVCAYGQTEPFTSSCTSTDSLGNYQINGLDPGDYLIEFSTFDAFEYYDNVTDFAEATLVNIPADEAVTEVSGIDADLETPPAAGAVLTNGRTTIGVNSEGDLNFDAVGLAFDGKDGIIPGCPCEGWGAGDANTGIFGKAGRTFGVENVEVESFESTASTAKSVVVIDDGAGEPALRVTHDFKPAAAADVFEVGVTIENLGDTTVDPRYRRAMDWDIPPTEFSEYVTIQGTENASNVLYASDDGFADGNPFAEPTQINFTGDAVDDGPNDHGALFDFGFDEIAPSESVGFKIYYGAAADEAKADAALATIGAEIYSYGQPSIEDGATLGTPNTFLFAFTGVGGQVQFPAISGTVTGPSGDPLENIWVLAVAETDGFSPTAIELTKADGTYAFGNLPPGTYRIAFLQYMQQGLVVEWWEDVPARSLATPLVVTASTSVVNPFVGIDAAMETGGQISGVLTGPDGAPVAGARVAVYLPTDGLYGFRTTTAADGSYSFPDLRPGSYKVAFRPPAGSGLRSEWYDNVQTRAAATDIELEADEEITANAQLAAR